MAKAEATVEELVGMIERGDLRLPEMQRRYVWRSTRVRGLARLARARLPIRCDSLWETDEDVTRQRRPGGVLARMSQTAVYDTC